MKQRRSLTYDKVMWRVNEVKGCAKIITKIVKNSVQDNIAVHNSAATTTVPHNSTNSLSNIHEYIYRWINQYIHTYKLT